MPFYRDWECYFSQETYYTSIAFWAFWNACLEMCSLRQDSVIKNNAGLPQSSHCEEVRSPQCFRGSILTPTFPNTVRAWLLKQTTVFVFAGLALRQTPSACVHGHPGERTADSGDPLWKHLDSEVTLPGFTAWSSHLLAMWTLGKLCPSLSPHFSLESGGWHNGSLITVLRGFNKPKNIKLLEQSWIKVG